MDKVVAYLLEKETITGAEMVAIIEGRDPAEADSPLLDGPKPEAVNLEKPHAPEPPAPPEGEKEPEIEWTPLYEEKASEGEEAAAEEDPF